VLTCSSNVRKRASGEGKPLRLVAARERMLVEGLDAASAVFEVGYESTSEFYSKPCLRLPEQPIHCSEHRL
jgi:hypothetical protein